MDVTLYKIILRLLLLLPVSIRSQENVQELGRLPDAVTETSGLLFFNGKLITHNDSGNTPQLYEIDTLSVEVTRTVTIINVDNIDWEDLAQDEDYIYIGDFGNNIGMRTDLAIYRIDKQDYVNSELVEADRIDFSYEDQVDFINDGNSDWDAEAFFVLGDDLIILTKQWESNGTVAYSIPKTPGTYLANRIETFDSQGLITGATYNPLSDALFLIGYSSTFLNSFVLRIESPSNTSIFGGTKERFNFGAGLAQTEGITYVDVNSYLVTSEFFTNSNPSITLEAKLFSFTTLDELDEGEDEPENPDKPDNPDNPDNTEEPEVQEEFPDANQEKQALILFRTFGSDILEYELKTERAIFGRAIFDVTGKRVAYILAEEIENNMIDLSQLGSSVYYLTFYLDNTILVKAFAK